MLARAAGSGAGDGDADRASSDMKDSKLEEKPGETVASDSTGGNVNVDDCGVPLCIGLDVLLMGDAEAAFERSDVERLLLNISCSEGRIALRFSPRKDEGEGGGCRSSCDLTD